MMGQFFGELPWKMVSVAIVPTRSIAGVGVPALGTDLTFAIRVSEKVCPHTPRLAMQRRGVGSVTRLTGSEADWPSHPS